MNISTKDAMGKMFFTMTSAFAELEVNLLCERIKKTQQQQEREAEKAGAPLYQRIKNEKLNFYMMNKRKQGKKQLVRQGYVTQLFIELIKK